MTDRKKAIQILKRCEAESYCSHYKRHHCCIGCGQREALDLAIKALEREIEYGQMVVDFTKGETMKSDEWKYDTTCDAESATTTDCISRKQAVEAIEGVDWYHVNPKGELVSGSTSDEESWYKAEDIYEALESLKPVTPPGKVLAEIKVDTEELVERIKEAYQLEQEHGRLIDVDKLLQELFNVDEEEWTTPEMCIPYGTLSKIADELENIQKILEKQSTTEVNERTGKWIEDGYYNYSYYVCSNCGQECGTQNNGVEIEPLCTKYCPNCGARMGK